MNSWVIIFRVLLLIIGILFLSFDVLLYNSCQKQKIELDSIKDKQDVEAEFNSNKFKYQADQIERISNDLEGAQQQIKDQKDALADQREAFLQEVQKRQQIANENKGVETSLIDIKAETDAIKQDLKGWQKDYVSVLAQLEKKMDDSQDEIKNVQESLNSLKADIDNIAPVEQVKDKNENQP
jgi:chromosome segregation ATPase